MIYVEYLLGSIVVIATLLILGYFLNNEQYEGIIDPSSIRYRQSHIHELVKDTLPEILGIDFKEPVERQSTKHEEKTNIKVIIMEDKAYWIKDNSFYVADFVDNMVDRDSVRIVDTMSMDKVQLDKMFFIMDQLREGRNP